MAFEMWKLNRIGLRTKIVGLLVFVLLLLLVFFVPWTIQAQRDSTEAELLEESRVLVTEMDAFWEFISINQDTINYTSDGIFDYKSLHCAIAGKSVATLFSKNSDYSMRFTKVNPRNGHNAPDEYETTALNSFSAENEVNEYYGFAEYQGQSVFRYVSAMKVSEDCIECHGKPAGEIDITGYPKEGWATGEIAGAVSVTVPTDLYYANMQKSVINNILFFLAILACMATIIYFALSRLITRPLSRLQSSIVKMGDGSPTQLAHHRPTYSSREVDELFSQFNSMAESLSALHTNLESQVSDRTAQLFEANKELERQRIHIEEVNNILKQENRYKSDFLAIVSHEIRTPLTSILAFSELMSEEIGSDDALLRQQAEEIEKNSNILLEMVDNILETARIQAGSEKVNVEVVDINDIVGLIEASSVSLAQKKSITLTTSVEMDVPLIESDWEKVRRILLNLVSNAIKFTPLGGKVSVAVSYQEPKASIRIDVTDNGIGIPLDKQKLIFERFRQENMTTVRRYGGSGLGLSLVKDLVEMLGGTVCVESEIDQGSTFTVILPVKAPEGVDNGQDNDDR